MMDDIDKVTEDQKNLFLLILYCNGGEMDIEAHKKEYFAAIKKYGTAAKAVEHYKDQTRFLPRPTLSD